MNIMACIVISSFVTLKSLMDVNDTELAEKTRTAFRELTTDQREFIFKKIAISERKHNYFKSLFDQLHITGFSRPHLVHTWVGAFPRQRIDAFLLTEEGEMRLQNLLRIFFTVSYRDMNDRFIELSDCEKNNITVTVAEKCLAQVRKEMHNDPFLRLYEASVRWIVLTGLNDSVVAEKDEKPERKVVKDAASVGEHGELVALTATALDQSADSSMVVQEKETLTETTTPLAPVSCSSKKTNDSLVTKGSPEPPVIAMSGMRMLSTLSDLEPLMKQAAKLRVVELCDVATQLKKALGRLTEIEVQLTTSADRLQKKVVQLKKTRWLCEFRPPEPVCAQSQAIVGDELRRMQQLDGKLARLLQIVEQMMELEGRIEEPLPAWEPPSEVGLKEIIEAFEFRIGEITRRIETAATIEKTLVNFVDSFGTTDENTGPDFLANVTASEFCEVALGILRQSRNSEESVAIRRIRGRVDIVGLILAHVWRKDATQALGLVQGVAGFDTVIRNRVEAGKVFAFLSYTQMREIAERVSAWAPMVAELLFAGALGRNRPELLEYLDPILDAQGIHPVCVGFYRAVVAAFHRGQLGMPRAWMEGDSVALAAADTERTTERQRRELLDYMRRTPGMVGYYHRMRVFARTKFLRPLEHAIEAGNASSAMSQWGAYGGLEKMVNECAGAVEGRYSLDQSHFQQIRRYLCEFENKLKEWRKRTSERQLPPAVVRPIRDTVAGLRRETGRGLQASTCCRSLLQLLEGMAGGSDEIGIPALDFGERCDGEGMVHVDPEANIILVTPFMLRSWPGAVAQECVALDDLLHDYLRSGTEDAEPQDAVVLRSYLRRGHNEAARRMGERREDWGRTFAVEIERLTAAFRHKHERLLAEAVTAREVDRDISDCLVEIENGLANGQLNLAEDWIRCLQGLVDVYRKRLDPVLCSLREFLVEAGQAKNENLGAEELRNRIQIVRKEHIGRRIHIYALCKAAQQNEWSLPLRTRWEETATQLDRPRLWPKAETASELGNAIQVFGRYMSTKLKWRKSDPSTTDAIVDGLGEWVPTQLAKGLAKGGSDDAEALMEFIRLAKDVDEDCPSSHVLQVVGVRRSSASPTPEMPVKPIVNDHPSQTEVAKIHSEQVISDLRVEMRRLLPQVCAGGHPDLPALRDALRQRDWSKAQALAGGWLDTHANLAANSPMNDTEAACLLSLAGGALTADHDDNQERLWTLGCWALGAASLDYYLQTESQEEMAARLFARLAGANIEGNASQTLKAALEGMDDLPSTEIRSRPLAKMFRVGTHLTSSGGGVAASRLARLLWNSLRMETNYRPRASLLQLLFRLGHIGVIESLADTARPHQKLVVNCVRAFAHAESNPDARLHGLQLRRALEDRGGLRPWQLFMKQIDTGQATQEEAAVTCRLESEFVTQEPDGRRTIELRLVPSLANPPQHLILRLGSDEAKGEKFILQNEPLYGDRTVTVDVPSAFQTSDESVARIPFEMTGQTIFEKQVQVRGAWEVKFDDKPAVPIPPGEITKAWPGASGNPVTRMKGFYGRDRELAAICAYVEAPARPRSVMVFGQRRIGKTSLLKEAVASFDNSDRHGVTGAFFDVSGLKLAADGNGMATAFFRYLMSQMHGPDNAHLKPWLNSEAQVRLEHRLAGVNPEASLLDCFDTVAQHLEETSLGRVRRLALLVDEFDRFVQPLLSGHREHVQQFLWNLRQVVQRADRVSLVLAGSGMQKLLKQGYEDALFGSIDEVQLEPFSWKEDKNAVLDTVFPSDFRSRLCRPQEAEKLAEKACELCGGHPMFLALLGSAAALLSRGRRLSPDFLNRVVERLVREGINEPCLQIRCKDFYTPTFQTLLRLPRRTQALAQLILVHVAERTTPDFAWESVSNTTEAEAFPQDVSRNEVLEGLKRLEEERVITWDRSRSRVRITVPLTAAALRQEVFLLRDDAIQLYDSHYNS